MNLKRKKRRENSTKDAQKQSIQSRRKAKKLLLKVYKIKVNESISAKKKKSEKLVLMQIKQFH